MLTNEKRITILCGHYGTGKTNVAVNLALAMAKTSDKVTVADLDIVNPYFRTLDSATAFEEAGIRLICSRFANTNVDLPSLPPDLYAITDDKTRRVVIDVGGDDSGAMVLGRLAPAILAEDSYEMYLVVNRYRPLTPDVPSTVEVMGEIEAASRLTFTGIVNNSNLGAETTAQDVLDSVAYATELAQAAHLPLVATTVEQSIYPDLEGQIPDLFPLTLQNNKPF
ncbi:MAG: P-loop NTPase [Clostridia bacterium]|nr:P-loop NTPase [Clostridia bacterium]